MLIIIDSEVTQFKVHRRKVDKILIQIKLVLQKMFCLDQILTKFWK